MGLDAQVIAIGPFNNRIVEFLCYPAEFYKYTKEGAIIICPVFTAVTSDMSYELAEFFGVHPWDFNSHVLDPSRADAQKLLASEFVDEVPRFLALRDAGFKFYYLPNG